MKYLLFILGLSLSVSIYAQTPYFGNNNRWGVKDDSGKLVVPCVYSQVSKKGYSEGLLGVVRKNKWGFIDVKGTVVIPFQYSAISSAGFTEGVLACAKKDKWGYIDVLGREIIDSQYDYALPFGDGLALVCKGKDVFFIDKSGEKISNLKIDNLADGYMFHEGKCVVGIERGYMIKYGVIDCNGNWIVPAIYDKFDIEITQPPFDKNGIAKVEINGITKYLSINGKEYDTLALALQGLSSDFKKEETDNILAQSNTKKDVRVIYSPNESHHNDHSMSVSLTKEKEVEIVPQKSHHKISSDIPQYRNDNENTFAVIIANENYRRESTVEYALNDGREFKEYCRLYLGIPESNIRYVENATLNDMKAEINWITKVAEAYAGKAKLIFYYAGHGIPDEATRTSYLLPADGFGTDVTTGYKLDDLYASLSSVPAEYAVAFLDACFSGGQRDGGMMTSARGVAIKAKPSVPKGNLVVFSAAQEDETAYPYKDCQHGLFTYYLLEKIKETKGKIAFGELADFISDSVKKKSIVMNSKSQTPSVSASSEMIKWDSIKLY